MHVRFETTEVSADCHGEIDAVLQRIAVGDGHGQWKTRPDEIRILAKLAGGRSGAEVFEAVVKRGNHESRKVIKLGPSHELRNEFRAFFEHLRDASSFFVRIEAVTPALLEKARQASPEREAVVYDHASRSIGKPTRPTKTLERIARGAVAAGGQQLLDAVAAIQRLFEGVRNDLYDKHVAEPRETLRKVWNHSLGDDAKIAITKVHRRKALLETTKRVPHGRSRRTLHALDLAKASVSPDERGLRDALVKLHDARLAWWGNRLMAEVETHNLRVEVVADGRKEIHKLARDVGDGSRWSIEGRLIELRALKHRDYLLRRLPELKLDSITLSGPGARVPDPFVRLADVLQFGRRIRVASLVHGDLNPQNVLLVDGQPCLIDYAFTRTDEPILIDFARLEGCLAREVLPTDLTWAQHVRLQRLLVWVTRLGDEAGHVFAERLQADRPALGHAFQLFWAVRRAAREVYPNAQGDAWLLDYLEQLFLFAHLTLKWDNQPEAALRATAAMAGVSAEALAPEASFGHWDEASLRGDGIAVVDLIRKKKQLVLALPTLASFAHCITPLAERKDDPLQIALDGARAALVRGQFHGEANEILFQLRADHDVYINLRAFIELKGTLSAGRAVRRGGLSMEALLENEELLAEREHLRGQAEEHEALRLVAALPALVLLGDAGAGKSTVAREWEYRLAKSLVESDAKTFSSPPSIARVPSAEAQVLHVDPRLPLVVRASDVEARLCRWRADDPQSTASVLDKSAYLFAIGAVHIIVDALNELSDEQRQKVADWILALRTTFPQTPVLVCHRQYNYVPGLLPFPVVLLQKVELDQARQYIHDYLRERDALDHERRAKALVRLLLDSPDYQQVRDLARTPLFLWMLVERYRATNSVPDSRGRLFDDFSRWYLEERHHEEHGESVARQHSYETKAGLLGLLGYDLVRRHEPELAESELAALVPRESSGHWQSVLNEIVGAEMLHRQGGKLRFLHQTFQEYFAARHFLDHDAKDEGAIRARVREYRWHDTFALLLGFGGDRPDVIRQVIEEALRVNAVLTARCLRMAEAPDMVLLKQFVESQRHVLRDERAGEFLHRRAADALAEHGRGPARAALWAVAADPTAPDLPRVACLERLAAMPEQARFERLTERLRKELVEGVKRVFDEPAPIRVQETAIAAVVRTQMRDLSTYLAELVQAGEWPLQRAAWSACAQLRLKMTPRQEVAFATACAKRLGELEEGLANEAVAATFDALNEERLEIVRHLATCLNLSILLQERFAFGIHDEVAKIINDVVAAGAAPPAAVQGAWAVLTERPRSRANAIKRWLELIRSADEPTAMAAAHRLCELRHELPADAIRTVLDPSLSSRRLSAIAWIAAASRHEDLAESLEQLGRHLIQTVVGQENMEAFANVVTALKALDRSCGNRVAAVAEWVFCQRRATATSPGTGAWGTLRNRVYLSDDNYSTMLESGGDDARAAVYRLNESGGATLEEADRTSPANLRGSAMRRFQELAEAERERSWQHVFSRAAVKVEATGLVPWLLKLADSPGMNEGVTIYHSKYGRIEERFVADVLRAIGYMARMLFISDRAAQAQEAVSYLCQRHASVKPDEERCTVVGLATGLGYLGEWEPILTHLGPGEPWMHDAAVNVFENWVPSPLAGDPEKERERAAHWVIRRLRDDPSLPAEVRSTLTRIKDRLEGKLGRHVVEAQA